MPSFGGLFAVTELRSHKDYERCEKQRRNTAASGAKNLTVLWTRSRIKATALCLCAFGAGIWQFTKPQNKRCHPAWATWAWPKEAWQHDQEKIRQHVTCCMGKVTCNKDPGWFASRLRITGLSCQSQAIILPKSALHVIGLSSLCLASASTPGSMRPQIKHAGGPRGSEPKLSGQGGRNGKAMAASAKRMQRWSWSEGVGSEPVRCRCGSGAMHWVEWIGWSELRRASWVEWQGWSDCNEFGGKMWVEWAGGLSWVQWIDQAWKVELFGGDLCLCYKARLLCARQCILSPVTKEATPAIYGYVWWQDICFLVLPCPSLSFLFFPFPSLFFLAVPCCSFFLPCSFLSSLVLQIWPALVAVRFPAHNQHQPANKHNAKLNDNEKKQTVYIFLGNGTSTAGAKAMNVSTKSYHILLYIILYSLLLLLLSFASPPYSSSSCLLISATLLTLSYSTTLPSRNWLQDSSFFALFSLPCSLFDAPILRFDPASISGSSQVAST